MNNRLIGFILFMSGFVMIYAGVKNINPLELVKNTLQGKKTSPMTSEFEGSKSGSPGTSTGTNPNSGSAETGAGADPNRSGGGKLPLTVGNG